MLFKQSLILAVACAAALSTIACDESTDDSTESLACTEPSLPLAPPPGVSLEASVDDISFREPGPPSAIYVTEWQGAEIHRAQFAAITKACLKHGDPQLTCTLSWYDPDTSTADGQVVGIGCSAVVTAGYVNCYRDLFLQYGGQEI